MNWSKLALKSIWHRKIAAVLTVTMIASSLFLLLTVDRIRQDTQTSFANTLSQTDLIVGGRTGSLNLLLYSVFRIGNATNNISWDSFQKLANHPDVEWVIPISLGDSHRGYRVIATDENYLKYYRYAGDKALALAAGVWFDDELEVVLGAEVARQLGYKLGEKIVISHGIGSTSFADHDDKPFLVSGILAPTGTPIDKSLHISLEGMTAIHLNWQGGLSQQFRFQNNPQELTPDSITAFLVGMKSRLKAFNFQRMVNEYPNEPLMAIIPGAALQELWQLMRVAENALVFISIFVVATSLIGMLTVILSSLNERRREIAIFRAIGAKRRTIIGLLMFESSFYGFAGLLLGYSSHLILLAISQNYIQSQHGIVLNIGLPNGPMLLVLLGFILSSALLGIIPGVRAYRRSLSDGLSAHL